MQTFRTGTCKSTPAGFTLAELVVVLGIVGLMLVYVAPNLAGGETGELKASARHLLYTVRRLSDEALSTKTKRVLTVDIDRREYWDADGRVKTRLPNHVVFRSVTFGTDEILTTGVVTITCYPSGLRDQASIILSGRTLPGGAGHVYRVVIPALGERFEVRDD